MATRKIFNDTDMAKFLESSAKKDLLRFTTAMGRSVASFPDERTLSPPLACLEAALQTMLAWRTTVPPHDDENIRFGNPAFREWHERLVERAPSIVTTVLECTHETDVDQARESGRAATTVVTESDDPRVLELCSYLQAAFGHPVRLDYGTGHESSFQVFLWCLCQLGCVSTEQPPSAKALSGATLSLYSAYLNVTRQLQTDYRLEPAGSHGVWGLDDYHCIPFYLGACQLQSSEYMPESIHDARVLDEESEHYLYFACIRYIKSLKKATELTRRANISARYLISAGLSRIVSGVREWPTKAAYHGSGPYQAWYMDLRPQVIDPVWIFWSLTWPPQARHGSTCSNISMVLRV